MSNFGDWLPGAKENKMRAEAVVKRRNSAAALTADLDLEFQDLQVSLQLDQNDFKPGDLVKYKAALDRAQSLMNEVYGDVTWMADHPVPDRINELQAHEFMQPALRIESRSVEARKAFETARQYRQTAGKPRVEADANLAGAEKLKLNAEISLVQARQIAADLKAALAENYPQVEAALLTAQSEVLAATQMVTASRLALGRQAWREANDLSRRASTIFESAAAKFQMIELSKVDYSQASQEADDELAAALKQLSVVRTTLQGQVAMLPREPNFYLTPAVQRLGEARRAFKANPPQFVTALRLAKEARTMIDQGQSQALDEVYKIRNSRQEARQLLTALSQAVQDLRLSLNSQRTVPVKANEAYAKARAERDRLLPREPELDKLSLPQLAEITVAARTALQTAQAALKLVGQD